MSSSASTAEYTPHEPDPMLLEAFHYINQVPGKDIRGKLIDAFQRWFKIPDDKVVAIKELIGELHNASLLIDDIEDDSTLRRGIPVAHSIYGVPTTINCANYVYFLAHLRLKDHSSYTGPETMAAQKSKMALICCKIARFYEEMVRCAVVRGR